MKESILQYFSFGFTCFALGFVLCNFLYVFTQKPTIESTGETYYHATDSYGIKIRKDENGNIGIGTVDEAKKLNIGTTNIPDNIVIDGEKSEMRVMTPDEYEKFCEGEEVKKLEITENKND